MGKHEQRAPETQWDIVTSVGLTALAVAGGRAAETERDDRLVDDPYADPLVRAADSATVGDMTERMREFEASTYIGVRSRFFDSFFTRSCDAGIRQAVILASGLDTRPQRLDWPAGSRTFEIDQPLVLEFKDTVLNGLGAQPACDHHPIPVDLRDDWPSALIAAGFDSTQPTAWLAEGLLPYLPADAEAQLLHTVNEFSAPGSRISIECFTERNKMVSGRMGDLAREMEMDLGQLFNFEDRPDPADQFAGYGWDVRREYGHEVATSYGRTLSEFEEGLSEHQYFLTAELPR